MLLENTAGEKFRLLLDCIYEYRESQEKLLEANPDLTLGDVTTINVTKIQGGKQRNVLPPLIELTVDIRMSVTTDTAEFEKMLHQWVEKCGGDIKIEFPIKEPFCPPTKTDESNIYWTRFVKAINDMNLKIKPQVFPAGTDIAYVRAAGVPAFGFSPMINTPILLHDHDEYLHAGVYLDGIEVYKRIISEIANAEE